MKAKREKDYIWIKLHYINLLRSSYSSCPSRRQLNCKALYEEYACDRDATTCVWV